MDWQLAIILTAVALATIFVGWRMLATFAKKDCNECGCKGAANSEF